MQGYIIVKLRLEGIHSWPSCPHRDVAFLRQEHRHEFHIKALKQISHNDRDIEIIRFKRQMTERLVSMYGNGRVCDFGSMSCEMIAEELIKQFDLSSCEVLEDGENGAVLIA